MDSINCVKEIYSSSDEGVTVDRVVTEEREFDDVGIGITRVETPNNQLKVLVGEMADGTPVEFDVKFSVDERLMSIEMYWGDPRSSCGVVEDVERSE